MAGIADRFVRFAGLGWGLSDLRDVSPEVAAAFVGSAMPDGSSPGVSTMHMRRSTLRLLFGWRARWDWPRGTRRWIWDCRLDPA
jgi:hypothetical protein